MADTVFNQNISRVRLDVKNLSQVKNCCPPCRLRTYINKLAAQLANLYAIFFKFYIFQVYLRTTDEEEKKNAEKQEMLLKPFEQVL